MDDLFNNAPESDPTADFLAREKAILGDEFGAPAQGGAFDKDFEQSASAFPALDGANAGASSGFDSFDAFTDGNDGAAQAPPSIVNVAKGPYEGGMGAQQQQHVSATGHDDIGAFEQEYPAIDVPEPQQPQQAQAQQTNGFSRASAPQSDYNSVSGMFAGAPQPQVDDSEFIRNWRVKQKEEIARREEESTRRKEETIVKAQNAIDNFYKDYNATKEKNIAKNKEEEIEFNEKRTEELAKGTTWERICAMIELQDSRSKTTTKSKQDLSRFKEILLGLKREGETAPGAAGY